MKRCNRNTRCRRYGLTSTETVCVAVIVAVTILVAVAGMGTRTSTNLNETAGGIGDPSQLIHNYMLSGQPKK